MFDIPLFVGSFVAGVLMFLAPCTLPIVPGYLAFIAGIPLSALSNPAQKRHARAMVMKNALAFCLGFSAVFMLLGASAGLIGSFLGEWRVLLAQAGGAIIILFGLTMLGVVPLSFLMRERHMRLPAFLTLGKMSSSALIGGLFALGWSPCIGPLLATVLLLASGAGTFWYGVGLLAVFSLGLSIPFLLCALLINETTTFLTKIGWLTRILMWVGGLGLILTGILMLTGKLGYVIASGYYLFYSSGWSSLLNYF